MTNPFAQPMGNIVEPETTPFGIGDQSEFLLGAIPPPRPPRMKVWPEGKVGEVLLLRTGSSEWSPLDEWHAGDTPAEIARFAVRLHALSLPCTVVVKDFDRNEMHTITITDDN